MNRWTNPALGAAVALSAIAVADAVLRGTGAALPPWDPDGGTWWAGTVVDLAHGGAYALFAAVLVSVADTLDTGRTAVRWLRRVLVADLAVLATVFLLGAVRLIGIENEAVGAIAAVGFVLMFVLGAALGGTLVRRTRLRLPAALMIAPVGVIPLTFLVGTVAPGWGHPAYAEAALYIGLALLGRSAAVRSAVVSSEPGLTSPHS